MTSPAPIPKAADLLARIESLPRLGWVNAPTPVAAAPELSAWLGASVYVKRDDLTAPLFGGTKTRKLDYLLAAAPFAEARAFDSIGATGSGHLVACSAAAELLHKEFHAHIFWEPVAGEVLDNLAFTASRAASIRYSGNRVTLALRSGAVLRGAPVLGRPSIPPGGSTARGTLGVVRGALELAAQIEQGVLPVPDFVLLPFGSGGSSAGLALGLELAGLPTKVLAFGAVERWMTSRRRQFRLMAKTAELLQEVGLAVDVPRAMARWILRHGVVGRGYGIASAESEAAVEVARRDGLKLEAIYLGKALAGARKCRAELAGKQILLWQTNRAELSPPPDGWIKRLPQPLESRISSDPTGAIAGRRRKFLLGSAAAAVVGGGLLRTTGYPEVGASDGPLYDWEKHVLAQAAEAIFGSATLAQLGVDAESVGPAVDAYVTGMPPEVVTQLHAMFLFVEQGTFLGLSVRRLSSMDSSARKAFLQAMLDGTEIERVAAISLRNLVLVGVYQQPASWQALGYDGPLVPDFDQRFSRGRDLKPPAPGPYDHLRAHPSELPKGVVS